MHIFIIQYARNFGQRELMMIHGDFLSWNTANSQFDTDYAVIQAVGLRAKIDKEIGWHKNISNVAILFLLFRYISCIAHGMRRFKYIDIIYVDRQYSGIW